MPTRRFHPDTFLTAFKTAMPNLHAISPSRHAGKFWTRPKGCAFARNEALIPLAGNELPPATLSLPIALIPQGEGFVPAAVTSFQPGSNLFVSADGRWTGGYAPACLRAYPFSLVKAQNGQHMLCIDADSQLVSDHEGEPFFAADGQPGAALAGVLELLEKLAASRAAVERACATMQKHQLIQPWSLTIQASGGPRKITGLFRIDEKALNSLPTAAFEEIRQAGALPLAYCQLLSMQHVPRLVRLTEEHETAPLSTERSLDLLSQGGTLRFDNL